VTQRWNPRSCTWSDATSIRLLSSPNEWTRSEVQLGGETVSNLAGVKELEKGWHHQLLSPIDYSAHRRKGKLVRARHQSLAALASGTPVASGSAFEFEKGKAKCICVPSFSWLHQAMRGREDHHLEARIFRRRGHIFSRVRI